MYEQIKGEKGLNVAFSNEQRTGFMQMIADVIMTSKENPPQCMAGSFVCKDIPLKDGRVLDVFIEWTAKPVKGSAYNVGMTNCIVFDAMPDIVLDRINLLRGHGAKFV